MLIFTVEFTSEEKKKCVDIHLYRFSPLVKAEKEKKFKWIYSLNHWSFSK